MKETIITTIALVGMRLSLGWLMLYAGITKIMNADWTSAGYLSNAKTFNGFYSWLTQPHILPIIDFINEWALFMLGISLIFGIFIRVSTLLGVLLMLLYYFPVLTFPYVGTHSFIVDEHIIYILALFILFAFKAGRQVGFDKYLYKRNRLFSYIS